MTTSGAQDETPARGERTEEDGSYKGPFVDTSVRPLCSKQEEAEAG